VLLFLGYKEAQIDQSGSFQSMLFRILPTWPGVLAPQRNIQLSSPGESQSADTHEIAEFSVSIISIGLVALECGLTSSVERPRLPHSG
jgi:hypothetical protein